MLSSEGMENSSSLLSKQGWRMPQAGPVWLSLPQLTHTRGRWWWWGQMSPGKAAKGDCGGGATQGTGVLFCDLILRALLASKSILPLPIFQALFCDKLPDNWKPLDIF